MIDASKVIELRDYPPGTRIYLRAGPLHSGAKASLFDTDGNRVTAFLTNSPPRSIRRFWTCATGLEDGVRIGSSR